MLPGTEWAQSVLTICIIVAMREECPVVAEVPSSSGIYDLGLLPVLSYLSAFQICHHYLRNPGISNPDDFLTLDLLDLPFLTTSTGEAGAPTQLLWKVSEPFPGGSPKSFLMKPSALWWYAPSLHQAHICVANVPEDSRAQQETAAQSRKQRPHQGETRGVWVNKPGAHTGKHCAAVKKKILWNG